MRRQQEDHLGGVYAIPDDLMAVVEDSCGGFPDRPCVLPDEMRGALLLPSESEASFDSRLVADDFMGRDTPSVEQFVGMTAGEAGGSSSSASLPPWAVRGVARPVDTGGAFIALGSPGPRESAAGAGGEMAQLDRRRVSRLPSLALAPVYRQAAAAEAARPATASSSAPSRPTSSGVGLRGVSDIVPAASPTASAGGWSRDWSVFERHRPPGVARVSWPGPHRRRDRRRRRRRHGRLRLARQGGRGPRLLDAGPPHGPQCGRRSARQEYTRAAYRRHRGLMAAPAGASAAVGRVNRPNNHCVLIVLAIRPRQAGWTVYWPLR